MSGIYIHGMEMPKEGTIIAVYKLKGKFYVSMHGTELYPLVPVPDHGRLIDADALRAFAYARQKETGIACCVDALDISMAPTIIEADKED